MRTSPATRPATVKGAFVAEFDVRKGNTITFKWPETLDTPNFEWKALPSGSHAVSRDTIVFEAGDALVVCTYRARVTQDVTHRTASRAISAGLVIASDAPHPSTLLLAFLPHLDALSRIADGIVEEPKYDDLRAYAEDHRVGRQQLPSLPLCDASALSQLRFDPVTHLGAVHRFLGPLFVPLIKALYLPETRLLIYCPVPVARAATIAFNLAEIVDSALSIYGRTRRHVRIRGLVTVHDIDSLATDDASGWLAWTSDKILTEKSDIAHYVLDATDFLTGKTTKSSRPTVHTKNGPLGWSSRDAALFFELGEQESQYEDVLTKHEHPKFDIWRSKQSTTNTNEAIPPMLAAALSPALWRYSRQDGRWLLGSLIVMCAYIRFWLAQWWLVKAQLRVVIPSTLLVPLGPNSNLVEVPLSESMTMGEADPPPQNELLQPKDHRPSSVYSCDSDIDPLIAASGCVPHSPANTSPNTPRRPRPQPRRTILPAHPRFDACLARSLPYETLSGMYMFTLWSSWIRALHVHASAYLWTLIEPPREDEDAPLLRTPVSVSFQDMYAAHLQPREALDVRIVENIFGQWGSYDVRIIKPFFSWPC
ncbi:hypothetical protein MCUN1_000178 [Malassezia cuniculi]|uniref:Uncharacterized protein n=1 Tax=Malassezia cuniculi TaxID=948313 RepID=A0AAF0EQR3_9BASI|nr:hypothetical protein MCUN1_000178 [Malassezia cuniculi]